MLRGLVATAGMRSLHRNSHITYSYSLVPVAQIGEGDSASLLGLADLLFTVAMHARQLSPPFLCNSFHNLPITLHWSLHALKSLGRLQLICTWTSPFLPHFYHTPPFCQFFAPLLARCSPPVSV